MQWNAVCFFVCGGGPSQPIWEIGVMETGGSNAKPGRSRAAAVQCDQTNRLHCEVGGADLRSSQASGAPEPPRRRGTAVHALGGAGGVGNEVAKGSTNWRLGG